MHVSVEKREAIIETGDGSWIETRSRETIKEGDYKRKRATFRK